MENGKILIVMLLAFTYCVSAATFLPDERLRLDMSYSSVIETFPNVEVIFNDECATNGTINGLFCVELHEAEYWDSALLTIKASKLDALSYVHAVMREDEQVAPHDIILGLAKSYGCPIDCFVVNNLSGTGQIRSPAYAWMTKNGCVIFSHLPEKSVALGEPLRCRLTFIRNMEEKSNYFSLASNKEEGDGSLFDEATRP